MSQRNINNKDEKFSWIRLSPYLVIAYATVLSFAYMKQFASFGLSNKPEAWGQFGDYIGGLLNPLISLFILIVAVNVWNLQKRELLEINQSVDQQAKMNMGLQLFKQIHITINNLQFNPSHGYEAFASVFEALRRCLDTPQFLDPKNEVEPQFHRIITTSNLYAVIESFGLNILHIVSYLRKLDETLKVKTTSNFSFEKSAFDTLGASGSILVMIVAAINNEEAEFRDTSKALFRYVEKRSANLTLDMNADVFWKTFRTTFASKFSVEM